MLEYLKIPILYLGKERWYNLYALDKVLYYLSRVGGGGFVGPGTNAKNSGKTPFLRELTDEDIKVINSVDFTIEWLTMSYFKADGRPRKLKEIVKQARQGLHKTGASA